VDYNFFCQGKSEREVREYEDGFAVKNTLLDRVQIGTKAIEHILCLQLSTTDVPVNLLYVYAPTLTASKDNKDNFYNQLDVFIKGIPDKEELIILGDFNARVGGNNDACLGNFSIGKCNENGQRLLKICTNHELCVINTYFSTKPHHRVSFGDIQGQNTVTYHNADCNTDHSLPML
jgi:hypothetical protein